MRPGTKQAGMTTCPLNKTQITNRPLGSPSNPACRLRVSRCDVLRLSNLADSTADQPENYRLIIFRANVQSGHLAYFFTAKVTALDTER